MSAATRSTAAYDGKVNIALSTSSSMRSQDNMPHLIPQKTNVLTGAATKYFSNQTNQWHQDYNELIMFQRLRQKEAMDEAQKRRPAGLPSLSNSVPQSARMRPRVAGKIDASSVNSNPKLSLPLRGKGVAITDQLREIHERKDRMEMCYYQQKDIG